MTISTRINDLMDSFGEYRSVQHEFEWTTWGEFAGIRDQLAELLRLIPENLAIGLILRERPAAVGALFSLLALNRSVVQLTPIQPDDSLNAEILAIRPVVLLADGEDWKREGIVEAVHAASGAGIRVTACGAEWVVGTVRPDVAAQAGDHLEAERGLAITLLTSGTTGPAKRVPLSYDEINSWGSEVEQRSPAASNGATINSLPLVTVGGVSGLLRTAWRGRPLAMLDRFDPLKWARLVEEHKPRRAGAPPAAMRMILDAGVPAAMLESVETFVSGSAPLSPSLAAEFEERYGIPVLHGYGATEFLGRLLDWTLEDWQKFGREKRGASGRPVPGAKVRVVDAETGVELGADEVGTLEAHPARRPLNAPDGWIRTNDLARIDRDGFVWIIGRSDDVIIRGGFKVPPAEVEETIRTHPDVQDAMVVGLPDERLGEVPVAAVIPREGASISIDGLDELVRSRVAPYKVPVRYVLVEQFPRNAMMKPLRSKLREDLLSGELG